MGGDEALQREVESLLAYQEHAEGFMEAPALEVAAKAEAKDQGLSMLRKPQQVLVALETTRGLLVHDLLRSGYQVYAINPKAVSRYKDRYVVSKAKTDSLDASCLAHLLRTDRRIGLDPGLVAGRLSALGSTLFGSEKACR